MTITQNAEKRAPIAATTIAFALAAHAACGATPGRPITFPVEVESSAPGSFTTATGWTVTLEQASIVLGPIHVYAPEPSSSAAVALRRLLLPPARAHGGHDPFGTRELRAELLGTFVIDALEASRTPLGLAQGSEGPCSDLVVVLGRTGDEPVMRVAGLAERGDTMVPFRGALSLPEGLARAVEGIALAAHLDDRGTLVLRLLPERWLEQAQFDRLETREGDRFVIGQNDQVGLAWKLAARRPDSYEARWLSGGPP